MKLFYSATLVSLFLLFGLAPAGTAGADNYFQRQWSYVSETSAVVYWQLGDISSSATSFIEYGKTRDLGQATARTGSPRWSQLHRLTGLNTGVTYYYRMAVVDPRNDSVTRSDILQFTTRKQEDAVRIPTDLMARPPYVLDRADTRYILTRDIICDGTAFEITQDNITLDLDGHTVIFGDDTDNVAYGVLVAHRNGKTVIANGHIVQGRRSKESSAAVSSLKKPQPLEVFGISTDVRLKCAIPLDLSSGPPAKIHHNHIYSRVTELESRHQPGNTLLLVGGDPIYLRIRNVHIHDNLLTEGCHRGIHLREVIPTVGSDPKVEVDHNDIRHHQQYVNGYAIIPSANSNIHHNKITSNGRAVHLNEEGIRFHDNYIDTRGHMHLSDVPARFRPFLHRLIELHGIKLEGRRVKNCKVYNNFVRIVQSPPRDSDGQGDPVNKMDNGVHVRSSATALCSDRLVDAAQHWEADRWKDYFVKYSPKLPPARIDSNDATTLFADFSQASPGDYSIYMKWTYVPPTPLNIACYDPNAMNEVYNNKF
ncbi:MAG: fibronectin type III domain-containing protein, partial [Gemmatimonadota bacterium]|nr:fibronectin type III domain-containing protein [Gemmatimonadota bacterium]